MSVMNGCEDARRAVSIEEYPCPQCGEIMEIFVRDGEIATDAVCEKCGYTLPAGSHAPTAE
mgnify:CR=1 FL=1